MEGLSLSEAGDLVNSAGTSSKGKDKEEEMDILKSSFFKTLNRLPEEEQYIFADLTKKKNMAEKKEVKELKMKELKQHGGQSDPYEQRWLG